MRLRLTGSKAEYSNGHNRIEVFKMKEWSSLCKSKVGDAVDVREQCVIAMDDGAYKISDDQYFLADAFSDEGEEKFRLLSLYWACSEPAFRRAYYRDVEMMTWPYAGRRLNCFRLGRERPIVRLKMLLALLVLTSLWNTPLIVLCLMVHLFIRA